MDGQSVAQAALDAAVESGAAYTHLHVNARRVVQGEKDYEAIVLNYSLVNHWAYERYATTEGRRLAYDERAYYTRLMDVSRQRRLVYPYHLDLHVLLHTKIIPFAHYRSVLGDMLKAEVSYDTLPNFTAIDCLRLTGIGRNQYINLLNSVRGRKQGMFKVMTASRTANLPEHAVDTVVVGPAWGIIGIPRGNSLKDLPPDELKIYAAVGGASDDGDDDDGTPGGGGAAADTTRPSFTAAISAYTGGLTGLAKRAQKGVKEILSAAAAAHASAADALAARTVGCLACQFPREPLLNLYRRGYVYAVVAVDAQDVMIVPPLSNFVMNRTTTDQFEKFLYDILVSIDERTSIEQLAGVLEKDVIAVARAVSLFCRLGMARKRDVTQDVRAHQVLVHPSWDAVLPATSAGAPPRPHHVDAAPAPAGAGALATGTTSRSDDPFTLSSTAVGSSGAVAGPDAHLGAFQSGASASDTRRRVAFLFDSELTAYLMMSNLGMSKAHAVTLFEAGKMTDELIDSLLENLERIDAGVQHGEVQKFFDHAVALRELIKGLRHHGAWDADVCNGRMDLVRIESLNSLDFDTKIRVLKKNYWCVMSMSPLGCPLSLTTPMPNFFGNPIALVASPWFLLYTAATLARGPEMFLIMKGQALTELPAPLRFPHTTSIRMYPCTLDSHPVELQAANALIRVNEELASQSVLLVVGEKARCAVETLYVPFPLTPAEEREGVGGAGGQEKIQEGVVGAAPPAPAPANDLDSLFGPASPTTATTAAGTRAAPPDTLEALFGGPAPPAAAPPAPAADADPFAALTVARGPPAPEAAAGATTAATATGRPDRPSPDSPHPLFADRQRALYRECRGEVDAIVAAHMAAFPLADSVGYLTIDVAREDPKAKTLKEIRARILRTRRDEAKRGPRRRGSGTSGVSGAGGDAPSPVSASDRTDEPPPPVVTPTALSFGIPVFDPSLTQRVLANMDHHGTLSKASMERHSANMQRLAVDFLNFAHEHIPAGTSAMCAVKPEKSPVCLKTPSSVPFPARSLHFDGKTLKPYCP